MLSTRLAARVAAARSTLAPVRLLPIAQRRTFFPASMRKPPTYDDGQDLPPVPSYTEEEDPEMNGRYPNPPPVKRQFRDPHADWWDPQERRNFGEPVHEDNDLLGTMSPYEYTWTTPGKGFAMVGTFLCALAGLIGATYMTYPDIPAYPREFPGGLEKELGGSGATRARMEGDPDP